MKKSIGLLAIIVLITISASSQTQKWYNYCYAYNAQTKVIYFSEVIIEKAERIPCCTEGLENQWRDEVKTLEKEYFKWEINTSSWNRQKEVYKSRKEKIGDYKQKGYTIKYAIHFKYIEEYD